MSIIPAPTGNRVVDLLAERRAAIMERERTHCIASREMLDADIERLSADIMEAARENLRNSKNSES